MSRKKLQPRPPLPLPDLAEKPGFLDDPAVRRWLPLVALALVTFVFLSPVLRGVYIWDDDAWLTLNPTISNPRLFGYIWIPGKTPHFYPLVFTSYWLEYRLWGLGITGPDGVLRGVGYHVDNLLLHLGSVLLIFNILKRLKLPGGELGAWLSAAIFAIHPVNVESVAWVAERKNCLCGVFFFAAMLFGLRFFRVTAELPPSQSPSNKPDPDEPAYRWSFYVWALLLFIASMLSKTIACVLPPVFLLLIWWRRGRIRLREVLLTLPFFVISLGMGALTVSLETDSVGSSGPEWHFSLLQRFLIAGSDLWFYLGKLLVPFPLMQIYPRFAIEAGQQVTNALYFVAPVAFLALVLVLFFLRKKITRGPVTCVLFFAGVLAPALGFLNFYTMLYTFVADHYQYLACIGIIVLVVESVLWVLRRAAAGVRATDPAMAVQTQKRFYFLTAGTVWAGILVALGFLTYTFSGLYEDGEALWGYNLTYNQHSFPVLEGLAGEMLKHASILLGQKPPDTPAATPIMLTAKEALLKAMQEAPQDWRSYNMLGLVYLAENNFKEAGHYLDLGEEKMPPFIREGRTRFYNDKKLTIAAVTPDLNGGVTTVIYGPHYLIAKRMQEIGEWEQAIKQYQIDLKVYPGNLATYLNIGNCYFFLQKPEPALEWYHQAIEHYPGYAEAWLQAALALRKLHRDAEAQQAFARAQALDPKLSDHFPGQVAAYSSDIPVK